MNVIHFTFQWLQGFVWLVPIRCFACFLFLLACNWEPRYTILFEWDCANKLNKSAWLTWWMFVQAFKELDGSIHMHVSCAIVHFHAHTHRHKDKNVCIYQMVGGYESVNDKIFPQFRCLVHYSTRLLLKTECVRACGYVCVWLCVWSRSIFVCGLYSLHFHLHVSVSKWHNLLKSLVS